MKYVHKICLVATLFIISKIGFGMQQDQPVDQSGNISFSYLQSQQNNTTDEANRRIAEAYISPIMQNNVLEFMNSPYAYNQKTKEPVFLPVEQSDQVAYFKGMPKITEIIGKIESHNNTDPWGKAFDSAMQALMIAIIMIDLELAYEQNTAQPSDHVKQKIQTLQAVKKKLDSTRVLLIDKKEEFDSTKLKPSAELNEQKSINPENKIELENGLVAEPSQSELATYLNENSSVYLANEGQFINAANLLIYQCLMAQQFHEEFSENIYNYTPKDIFNTLKNKIINKVGNNATAAHILSKQLLQAINVAIFIARENSTYRFQSMTFQVWYKDFSQDIYIRDPLIKQLIIWRDEIFNDYFLNKAYGARAEDIANKNSFATIQKLLVTAGAFSVIAAGIYAALQLYPQKSIQEQMIELGKQKLQDAATSFTTQATEQFDAVKNRVLHHESATKSKWFENGFKTALKQDDTFADAEEASQYKNKWKNFSEWKAALQQAWNT